MYLTSFYKRTHFERLFMNESAPTRRTDAVGHSRCQARSQEALMEIACWSACREVFERRNASSLRKRCRGSICSVARIRKIRRLAETELDDLRVTYCCPNFSIGGFYRITLALLCAIDSRLREWRLMTIVICGRARCERGWQKGSWRTSETASSLGVSPV